MKDALAAAGGILLVLCALLTVVTINTGGVKHVDATGAVTEVLTWQGWQPAGAWSPPPVSAPPVYPTMPLPPAAEAPPPTPTPPPALASRDSPPAPTAARTEMNGSRYEGPPAAAGDAAGGATEPARLSPWEVLGWILVGLVSTGGVVALGLAGYHALARLRNRVLAACPGVVSPVAAPAGPAPAPVLAGTTGPGIDVAAFLADIAVPGGER